MSVNVEEVFIQHWSDDLSSQLNQGGYLKQMRKEEKNIKDHLKGFLGHKCTLLSHGQPAVRQDTQRSFPAGQPLTCTDACGYSSLGAGLQTCS